MRNLLQTAKAILKILQLFISALAPLMFLVGVIAGLDRAGAQRRLMEKLETYGQPAEAMVLYVDEEYNRAGVAYQLSSGYVMYGVLDLRYYPAKVRAAVQPDETVRIIYIDAVVSENDKTVLADHLADVRRYPLLEPDIWGILLIALLLIVVTPQFVFLGVLEFDELFKTIVPEKL